jgi:hypothetical protein
MRLGALVKRPSRRAQPAFSVCPGAVWQRQMRSPSGALGAAWPHSPAAPNGHVRRRERARTPAAGSGGAAFAA